MLLSLLQTLLHIPVPDLSFQIWIVIVPALALGSYGTACFCGGKLAGRSVAMLQLAFLCLLAPVAAEQVEKSARPLFSPQQIAALTPGMASDEVIDLLGEPVRIEPSERGACERWVYSTSGKWQKAQLFFQSKTGRLVALEWGK